MMEILGYISALIIGISLGLIGGGGSILTVPVMVYMLGIDPVLATAYSLFVVGVSSLFGAVKNYIKGRVSIKTAIVFAIPSFVAVFLTRYLIVPAIPEVIIQTDAFTLTKSVGIMLFFAIIMLVAAYSMIKSKTQVSEESQQSELKFNYSLIMVEGLVVGMLTGIVGAGGGFLIIPALVLLVRLPMKVAVGTSLLIISAKSLIGFLGDIGANQAIDWRFLLMFTSLAVIGIFAGAGMSNYIPGRKLKSAFGWFVLLMAIFIIIKELYFN